MNSKQKKASLINNLKSNRMRSNLTSKGSIDHLVETAEDIDLTGEQIVKICDGKVKVVPYHELVNVNSIEELIAPFDAVILLYETRLNFGHYTALLKDPDGNLEFFDSYGFAPDQELHYAKYDNTPYLTNLIAKYKQKGGKLVYNNYQFQAWVKDVNTCGRWTSTRVRLAKKYNLQQFQTLFQNIKFYNGDWMVSALTYLYTF
jgi:hypothetical protein